MIYTLITKILWNFVLLSILFQSFNQVKILQMSQQLSCFRMCKIMTWSRSWFFLHKSNMYLLQNLDYEHKKVYEMGPISTAIWHLNGLELHNDLTFQEKMGLNIGPSGIPGAINVKCEQSHYLTYRSRDDKQSMNHFPLTTLWPSDAIWWHKSGSILAEVTVCCLMAPRHYLNRSLLALILLQFHRKCLRYAGKRYSFKIKFWRF